MQNDHLFNIHSLLINTSIDTNKHDYDETKRGFRGFRVQECYVHLTFVCFNGNNDARVIGKNEQNSIIQFTIGNRSSVYFYFRYIFLSIVVFIEYKHLISN